MHFLTSSQLTDGLALLCVCVSFCLVLFLTVGIMCALWSDDQIVFFSVWGAQCQI